jgi:hypothetical protein
MLSTNPATIALSRLERGGVRTDHYPNLEDMLTDLLMNSGEKIPFIVRDQILPIAIEAWERSIKQDNCEHELDENGVCKHCDFCVEPP